MEATESPMGSDYVLLNGGPGNFAQSGQTPKEIHGPQVDSSEIMTDDSMMNHYGPSTVALARRAVVIYGTGHALNDLTAACWFTYLLIFLADVGLSRKHAGLVMLSGQVADGFATILVGQLIDRFGHFKLWHAGGSVLVALSFSSVFGMCIACDVFGRKSLSVVAVGYSTSAAIFNVGWAATQISHMSLVNCMTANPSSRVSLNSCRNAFSMVANLCLYTIAYVVFWAFPATSSEGAQLQFRWISMVAILVGSCFVVIFLLGVREPKLHHHIQSLKGTVTKIAVGSWFKRRLYYQVAFVYMLTRLTTNVSQAFLPFYLVDDLKLAASSKAVVPAVIYICSFLASIVLQELHWSGRRLKGVFTGGACLWIVSGSAIYLLPATFKSSIYLLAGVIGLGNALMLVTATSLQGVLVGHDLSGCAFVYGSLSFLDKLSCGFVLYTIEGLIEETQSCQQSRRSLISCYDSLIRLALGLVPGGCALLATVITLSMNLGDAESKVSSLSKPLLNQVESLTRDPEEGIVSQMKGSRPGTQNGKAIARPILPAKMGFTRTNRSQTEESELIETSMGEVSPLTFWKRLESAMVGRWGSIRKAQGTWLE